MESTLTLPSPIEVEDFIWVGKDIMEGGRRQIYEIGRGCHEGGYSNVIPAKAGIQKSNMENFTKSFLIPFYEMGRRGGDIELRDKQ